MLFFNVCYFFSLVLPKDQMSSCRTVTMCTPLIPFKMPGRICGIQLSFWVRRKNSVSEGLFPSVRPAAFWLVLTSEGWFILKMPDMESLVPILSKKGIYNREVVDFESQKGFNLQANNGVFIKNSKFLELLTSPSLSSTLPFLQGGLVHPQFTDVLLSDLMINGSPCFFTCRPMRSKSSISWVFGACILNWHVVHTV